MTRKDSTMPTDPSKAREDPAEGSRETIEHELDRQDRKLSKSREGHREPPAGDKRPKSDRRS
jgi:hypothetical protein